MHDHSAHRKGKAHNTTRAMIPSIKIFASLDFVEEDCMRNIKNIVQPKKKHSYFFSFNESTCPVRDLL